MPSNTKKISTAVITFIFQGYDLDGRAPSTRAGGPALAAAFDEGWSAATLPEVESRLRQLS